MTKHRRLVDNYPFYQKLDSNCPDSEKSGSGPGSCGVSEGAKNTRDSYVKELLKKYPPGSGLEPTKEEYDKIRELDDKVKEEFRKNQEEKDAPMKSKVDAWADKITGGYDKAEKAYKEKHKV